MTQAQAVKETLRKLGGVATLKDIYKHYRDIPDCTWKTQTPEATIRRIVQQEDDILCLRPGYYILKEFQDKMIQESLGEQVSILDVINNLLELPTPDARYDAYLVLNQIFRKTAWEKYSMWVFDILKRESNSTPPIIITTGNGTVFNDIHDNINPQIC